MQKLSTLREGDRLLDKTKCMQKIPKMSSISVPPSFAGNYSVTGFEMVLTRRMSHYMITYYLPSSLFVVVSWTSFLIPSEDIQGRMALLVTLFLVLVSSLLQSPSNHN